jgi:hypothetical protein
MDASPFEKDEREREEHFFLGIFPGKKSVSGS